MQSAVHHILQEQAPRFVQAVLSWLKAQNVMVDDYFLDHICYRVATQEEYEDWKHKLGDLKAELLIESMIGGRLISTFKLAEPIVVKETNTRYRQIHLLELPAPKPGRYYESGLEHVEFALLPTDIPRQEALTSKTQLHHFIQQYPHLSFNVDGLKKHINGDVRLDFKLDKQDVVQVEGSMKASVKFHLVDLETVIQLEKTSLSTTN